MPFTKSPDKARQYIVRLYKKQQRMLPALAKKLRLSEAQVMRDALEEKWVWVFGK